LSVNVISNKLKLTDRETFPGWHKIMESHLFSKGYLKGTGQWDGDAQKQSEAHAYIMGTLTMTVAGKTPNNRNPMKLI
jgi:hypothetical protein